MTILKDITFEELCKHFDHTDDIKDILEAVDEDSIEYLRYDLVKTLINEGYIEED